ncbi:MAG: CPBP family intramembrane metalloprotease [Candidatus Thorarchaeota archaeon]|nr:CPBP family intramembrane metalloprotease [Candidatus Thorarchaeota archaeon]
MTILLIVISRISLILVVQQIYILQGTPLNVASQNAQVFVSESSEGQAIASALDLLLILLLVLFLVTRIEKREFHLTDLGLNIQRNTLPFFGLGVIIGCALFFGATLVGVFLGTIELPVNPDFSQWPALTTLIASITFYVLNSFWQEILFRGYLQTQAVNRFGQYTGIILVTVIFVIFHGLVQTLTLSGILTGFLLFSFIGFLYDKIKSLYLVGTIHAVLNFLPALFDTWWQGLEASIIYGIALLLLILVIYKQIRESKEI